MKLKQLLLAGGGVVALIISGPAGAQNQATQPAQTQPAGTAKPEKESDGLTKRAETKIAAAAAPSWAGEKDVGATLAELLSHEDGKGLERIRLRGLPGKNRVTWAEVVLLDKDGKTVKRRAMLKETLTSIGEVKADESVIIAKSAINPMIRVARSLLDAEKAAGASGGEDQGAGAGDAGGAGAKSGGGGAKSGGGGGTSPGTPSPGTTTGTLPGVNPSPWDPTTGTNPGTTTGTLPGVNPSPWDPTTGTNPETTTGTLPGVNPSPWDPTTGTNPGTTTGTLPGVNPSPWDPTTGTNPGTLPEGTSEPWNVNNPPVTGEPVRNEADPWATTPPNGTSVIDRENVVEEPAIAVSATISACADRVDLPARRAYAQESSRSEVAGVVVEQPCSDTIYSYQITFDPIGCAEDVDQNGGYAYFRGRPRYVDRSGQPIYVDGCQRYDNQRSKISTTEQGCSHEVDVGAGVARIRSRKSYLNRDGDEVMVTACAASGATAALQWTPGGCSLRHDVGGGRTYQQQRRYYTYQGAEYPVGGCEDRAPSYAHYRTESGCTNIVNVAGQNVGIWKRTVVDTPYGQTTVQDCSADSTIGMAADEAGCAGQYAHNPAAGVSWGLVRYTYVIAGVLQATDCVINSNRQYQHQDAMGPWTHDDNARRSRQDIITKISTPTGTVVVSTRQGPWIDDYQATATETRPQLSAATYAGCQKTVPNAVFTTYVRTDGTSVTLPTGAAAPTVSMDGCSPLDPARDVLREWTAVTYEQEENQLLGKENAQIGRCFMHETRYREVRETPRSQNGAGEVFYGNPVVKTEVVETKATEWAGQVCPERSWDYGR